MSPAPKDPIHLNPKLISVQIIETPIWDSDNFLDSHSDKVEINKIATVDLEIKVHNSEWIIPYQFIYTKEAWGFSRKRIRNLPFFSIEKKAFYEELINILIHFDSVNEASIKEDFLPAP